MTAWFDIKGINYENGSWWREDFDVGKSLENTTKISEIAKEEIKANLDGNSQWLWFGGKGLGSIQAAQVASLFKDFIGGLLMISGGLTPLIDV